MTPYYSDDRVTIYHGDCRELLPQLPPADLIFTSPPYNLGNTTGGGFPTAERHKRMGHYDPRGGMKARSGLGKWEAAGHKGGISGGYGTHNDDMPHEKYVEWQREVLSLCWRALSLTGAIFYNHKPRILDGRLVAPLDYLPPELLPFVRQEIIWARSGGINFSPAFYLPTHERIVVIARRDWRLKSKGASGVGDVWSVTQETNNPHPAPFPIGLPARAIETTAPALVVDPFAGSGTTLRAAKDAGAHAIGIELEERWCEMAALRCRQEVLELGA